MPGCKILKGSMEFKTSLTEESNKIILVLKLLSKSLNFNIHITNY